MRWKVWILIAWFFGGGMAYAGTECPKGAVLELENHLKTSLATRYLEDSRWGAQEGLKFEEVFGIDLLEPEVRVYDEGTALVTGTWKVVGLQGGCRVESSRRFTHLWILVDGQWRLIQEHLALE